MSTTEDIALRLKLDNFRKELGKIDGLTKSEMEKMVAVMAKGSKQAAKEAEKAAKEAEKALKDAAKKSESAWSNLAKAAGFGDLVERFGKAGEGAEGLGLSSAVAAASVLAIGAAGIAAVAGVYKLERAGRDALDALDKIGEGDLVTAEQRAQVESANDALDAMGTAADALTVDLAAKLAPSVIAVSTEMIQLELFTKKVADAFDVGALSVNSWGSLLGSVVLGPVKLYVDAMDDVLTATMGASAGRTAEREALDAYARSVADNATAIHDDTKEQKAVNRVATDGAAILDEVTVKREKDSEAAKRQAEAAKRLAEAYKEEMDARRQIGEMGTKAADDLLTATEKVTAAEEEEVVKISKLADKAIEEAQKRGDSTLDIESETQDAITQIHERAERDRLDIAVKEGEDEQADLATRMAAMQSMVSDAAGAVKETWVQAHQAIVDGWAKADEAAQKYGEMLSSVMDSVGKLADLEEQKHQDRLDEAKEILKSERAAYKTKADLREAEDSGAFASARARLKHERTAIKEAFLAKKAAGIASALISGAEAVVHAFAMFGPPPSPVGIAAAAAAGLATGVEVATIASAKPPKFHRGTSNARGGAPEFGAAIAHGEGVVTQSGMAKPGAKETVDSLNGQGGGGAGTIIVPLYFEGRHIDDLVARAVVGGPKTKRALRAMMRGT